MRKLSIVTLLLAALALGWAPAAGAQDGPTLAVQQFAPNPGGGRNYMHVDGTATLKHLEPSVSVVANHAYRPLVLVDERTGDERDLLRHQAQLDLIGGIGLTDRAQLGLALPVTFFQTDRPLGEDADALSTQAVGDLRVVPKVNLLNGETGLQLAVMGVLSLPTGDGSALQGNEGLTFEPRAVAELWFTDRLRAGLNAGYVMRRQNEYRVLPQGNELTYGAGVAWELLPDSLTLVGETYGRAAADPDSTLDLDTLPLEATIGTRWIPAEGHALSIGTGPGLTSGYGTPTWRTYLAYSLTVAGVGGGGDGDRDGDGVADRWDRCPDVPEDRDGFEDDNGCPDPDNDRDGVPDTEDGCPLHPEDVDGFQDADGCPEYDNDGDRIADGYDRCPLHAEDADGFQDEDGCPDPDNDRDRILDAADACPNRPETYNGVEDEDGCPDEGRVKVTGDKVLILDKVHFDLDKASIKPVSFELLDQVAATLRGNPELRRVRVEGHTDSQGQEDYNDSLSEARAQAVRDHLVRAGVEHGRLEARGYGESRPVETNDTKEGRAKNRRVEFTILEFAGVKKDQP